jgi:AraC-like DNA-binding protein
MQQLDWRSKQCTRASRILGQSETLAATAAMSRSAFALRFKEPLGEIPLEYLTNRRMYKAAGLLQQDDRKLFMGTHFRNRNNDGRPDIFYAAMDTANWKHT